MKPKSILRSFLLGTVFFAASPLLHATVYYWDSSSTRTTAGFGNAAFIWGTDARWTVSSTGGTGTAITNTLIGDDLNFGSASTALGAGSVAVVGSQSFNSITYSSLSGAIALSGTSNTLASAASITVNNTTNSISNILAGASSVLTKSGSGNLTLSGVNTFGGGLNIQGGQITVTTTPSAVGTGTIQLGDTTATNSATTLLLGASAGTITNSLTVPVGLTGTATLTSASNNTTGYSGNITANDNLAIVGAMSAASNSSNFSGTSNTIATGKTISFSSVGTSTGNVNDSAIWGGLGSISYTGNNNSGFAISGAKTYSGGATLGSMSGAGVVEVRTSSTGPANAPTDGAFGTGTLSIGATKMRANPTGDITISNAVTFTANPTFTTVTNEKSLIFTGDAALGATRTLTVDTGSTVAGKNVEFRGVISGGGFGINKSGAGVLLLTGANTYSGTTTINTGILQLGDGTTGRDGTIANSASVVNNAALVYNRFGSSSYSGVISGGGTVAVSGAGSQTLTGVNTYSGLTTINSGATLSLGDGTTGKDGTIAATSGITNNGTLVFNRFGNLSSSAAISGTGAVTKTGAGTQTLTNATTNYTGATLISGGTLALVNPTAFASAVTVNSGTTLQFTPTAGSSIANVGASVSLAGTMTYNPTGQFFQALGGAVTVNGGASVINISAVAGAFTGLYLDGGLKGSTALTVNNSTPGVGLILRTSASTYSGAMIVNGAASATAGAGSGLAIGGDVGAAMSNANLEINGTLELGDSPSGMGGASFLPVAPSGTTFSINALSGTGVVVGNMANAASTRTFSVGNNNGTGSFSGVITNGTNNVLSFTKVGSGTQTLTGANTYTGNTTISEGTLEIAGSGNLYGGFFTDSTISVASGAQLLLSGTGANVLGFGASDTWIVAGAINSTGGQPQALPGTVTLNNGTLTGLGNAAAGDFWNFNGAVITANGDSNTISAVNVGLNSGTTLALATPLSTDRLSISSVLGVGSFAGGALTKTGLGTATLTGENIYTGPTNINGGTLLINGSTSSTSIVSVGVNGTLGGSGTIGGNTTISGTHNPGNSPGVQTFTNDLSYVDGGTPDPTVNWELTSNTSTNLANPNAVFDQIIVGGNLDFTNLTTINLSFNGSGSNVSWADGFWGTDQSWVVYDVAGTTSNFGNLTLNTTNWMDGSSNPFDSSTRAGNTFSLSKSGEDVLLNYTVVPEPSTALLGGIGLLALLRRKR